MLVWRCSEHLLWLTSFTFITLPIPYYFTHSKPYYVTWYPLPSRIYFDALSKYADAVVFIFSYCCSFLLLQSWWFVELFSSITICICHSNIFFCCVLLWCNLLFSLPPLDKTFLFKIPVKPTIFCMHITYIHRNITYIYNEPLATTSVIDGNIVPETVFILIIFIEQINGFCSHR